MEELLLLMLQEVGRVISAANEEKIRAAITALEAVLAMNSGEADRTELSEAAKTEGGKSYPSAAYAYVPDPDKPSGWKLRLWETPEKKESAAQVGRAVAALSPGGHRGEPVEIPEEDLPQVKARVRAAWKKVNPDKEEDDMPEHLAEAAYMSHDDVRERLSQALAARFGVSGEERPWVRDVFDDYLVYEFGGRLFQLDYATDDNGRVTIGEPFEVYKKTTYEPTAAAASEAEGDELKGEFVPLVERALGEDGETQIRIIAPGWGSSGYYSKKLLARDAAIYTPGTKMYWDHPTLQEERERPERSLRDLAAELVSHGTYQEDGPVGPGVYARAKVFGPYREVLEELAPHIGISHRAIGKAKPGEAEGRQGPVIEKLVAARSVDFVTTPGAGGEVVQLFEAARARAAEGSGDRTNPETHEEAKRMSEEKLQELEEARRTLEEENKRLREAHMLREARDVAAEKIGKSDLPEITQSRLIESLSRNPVVKDGELDHEEYGKTIDEAIKAEVEYISRLTGVGSGAIKGMGGNGEATSVEESKRRIESSFQRLGLSESAAKSAAQGR